MPLSDRDPNVLSGRLSRASNASNGSKSGIVKPDTLAAGVHTMLRTTTELGDVGSPLFTGSRIPRAIQNLPRFSHRSSGTSSRLSSSSSHTQAGLHKRGSNHHAWPSASSGPRQSLNGNSHGNGSGNGNVLPANADGMPIGHLHHHASSPLIPSAYMPPGGRSMSLTHAVQPPYLLSNHRSYNSLRSNDPVLRPRSPYHYPTRLKRPGYRSPSPAFSDASGVPPPNMQMMHPRMAPRPHTAMSHSRPPPPHDCGRSQFPHGFRDVMYATPPQMTKSREQGCSTPHGPRRADVPLDVMVPPMPGAYPSGSRMPTPSTELSSSSPAPPTPQDVASGLQFSVVSGSSCPSEQGGGAVNGPYDEGGPAYYDYSEQYTEKQVVYPQPPVQSVPMGFVQRIRTILEERAVNEHPPSRMAYQPVLTTVHPPASPVELPAAVPVELPATYEVKRITREMVLAAIEPSSEYSRMDSSALEYDLVIPTTKELAESMQETSEGGRGLLQEELNREELTGSSAEGGDFTDDSHKANVNMALKYSSAAVSIKTEPSQPDLDAAVDFASAVTAEAPDMVVSVQVDGLKTSIEVKESPQAEKRTAYGQRPQSEFVTPSPQELIPQPVRSLSEANVSAHMHNKRVPTPPSEHPKAAEKLFMIEATKPHVRPGTPINQTPVAVTITEPTANEVDVPASNEFVPISPPSPSISIAADASAVSPLAESVSRAAEKRRESASTTHLSWAVPIQANKVVSGLNDPHPTPKVISIQDSSTTDLRVSNYRANNVRLPDVKEEPNEEKNAKESRHLTFRFPIPPRIVHPRISAENIRIPTRKSSRNSVGRGPTPSRIRAFSDTRVIPSLQFSRSDLFAKLNEELDFESHETQSLLGDMAPSGGEYDIHSPVPQRPASSLTFKERYKSFFVELEELERSKPQEKAEFDLQPLARALSPVEIIQEVNRLSIPSVSALTQRLSELLPSLKKFYSDTEIGVDDEETVENTMKEIRGLGSGVDPAGSESQGRSTPNAEGANNIETPITDPMKPLPPLPGAELNTPIAELEAPLPLVLRERSVSDSALHTSTPESHPLHTSSTIRPWNYDASYPWHRDTLNIDISLPRALFHRDSITRRSSLLRLRMSNTTDGSTDTATTKDTQTLVLMNSNDASASHRISHGRGNAILRSISRRILPGGSLDANAFPQGPDILGCADRVVDPGDRYPTTGLSPPSAFNLEEVRSFFSDDSSQTERQTQSFRKRLTQLKSRIPLPRAHSALDSRVNRSGDVEASPSSGDRGSGSILPEGLIIGSSVKTYDGVGMSKAEFTAKKLLGKLKSWWYFAGDTLGRTFSRKIRNRPESDSFRDSSGVTLDSIL